ncbi:MAG: bifunctional oligoribonuclease/PAP phosphatase NrnA [Nitrospirae bacterium]|nr:bifunctional oligoribonuclease/PAP phosphatase NrnA [Nitrospirota bacterium]
MRVPSDLLSFIKQEDNFLIATHINPDGDALGSALALMFALESTGKKVMVFDRDKVPDFYRFLPGQERIIHLLNKSEVNSKNIILVDCNNLERTGLDNFIFRKTCVIDHHETEKNFGEIKWIAPEIAATGILIYHLLKHLEIKITPEIATNLYTAIVIDTGAFRYANTNADVLRISAQLVDAGANPAYISSNLYEMWSDGRFRLLIKVLNTLEIRDKIALVFVTEKMFEETGTSHDDTENFANFPRMMANIKVSILLRQLDNETWKISLRSKGDVNVAKVASLFDGGGHKNAAGCRIKGSIDDVKNKLVETLYRTLEI